MRAWVPPAVAASPDLGPRAQLAVGVAWLLTGVFLLLAATHFVAGRPGEAIVNVVLAAAAGAAPVILKRTGHYPAVLNAVLGVCFGALVSLCVEYGAGLTLAAVGLAEIPLFATLLGGTRIGIVWAVLSLGASIAVGVLGYLGIIHDATPLPTRLFDEHVALTLIIATLFAVAVLYELGKKQTLEHIERLEERHREAHRERIEAQADAKVARAERLASLGRIAATAAHEINNPLSYVANNLQALERDVARAGATPELRECLRDALDGVDRIRRIVTDLRGYTRPEDDDVTHSVDAARALTTAIKLAAGHTRSKAEVRTEIERLPRVFGNEGRLVQVFLNLIVNAAQAIPEGHAAQNRIVVRATTDGDEVRVEIEDSGSGIPPDVIDRISEPFFTTKPPGEGMGLGLALCQSMLAQVGGRLEFNSRPGRTIARVRLRASSEPAPASLPPRAASVRPTAAATILVVDDEPLVARALARVLRPHQVTVVASGREALRVLEKDTAFDLILCDMMMPDLTGIDVYEETRKRRPLLAERIVFMSGGTFTERAEEFRARVPNRFLDKPIDPAAIGALLNVREAASRAIA